MLWGFHQMYSVNVNYESSCILNDTTAQSCLCSGKK